MQRTIKYFEFKFELIYPPHNTSFPTSFETHRHVIIYTCTPTYTKPTHTACIHTLRKVQFLCILIGFLHKIKGLLNFHQLMPYKSYSQQYKIKSIIINAITCLSKKSYNYEHKQKSKHTQMTRGPNPINFHTHERVRVTHESGFQSDAHFYIINVLADCSRTQEHCLPVYKVLQVLSNTPPSSPPPPAKSNACNKLMQQFVGQLSPFSKQDFFLSFFLFLTFFTELNTSVRFIPARPTYVHTVILCLLLSGLHTSPYQWQCAKEQDAFHVSTNSGNCESGTDSTTPLVDLCQLHGD